MMCRDTEPYHWARATAGTVIRLPVVGLYSDRLQVIRDPLGPLCSGAGARTRVLRATVACGLLPSPATAYGLNEAPYDAAMSRSDRTERDIASPRLGY